MPERRIHSWITRLLLGRGYDEVHRTLDYPSLFLGPRHRRLFHDSMDAVMIGYLIGGLDGAVAAMLHILIDEICSSDEEFDRLLRFLASKRD